MGADVPGSTEEILHQDRFTAPDRDEPTIVRFRDPFPKEWTEVHAEGLGELETRIFLDTCLADGARARRAASGWDGDRYRVVKAGEGEVRP